VKCLTLAFQQQLKTPTSRQTQRMVLFSWLYRNTYILFTTLGLPIYKVPLSVLFDIVPYFYTNFCYSAAVLIGRVTAHVRPSICSSVRLFLRHFDLITKSVKHYG